MRIYGGYGKTKSRRVGKGKRNKIRRQMRAHASDGWERKKANGLRPQERASKKFLKSEIE